MTVAGRTITNADFQSGQASRRLTQNSRSDPTNGRTGATVDSQLLCRLPCERHAFAVPKMARIAG
jgi:hypothetical protein